MRILKAVLAKFRKITSGWFRRILEEFVQNLRLGFEQTLIIFDFCLVF